MTYDAKACLATLKNTVKMLSADSRNIKPGGLFLAVRGTKTDGAHYIKQAIDNGAVAIITHTDTDTSQFASAIRTIKVENPRQYFARVASAFYQPQPEYISAVTGTNGKTSVSNFVQQIWTLCGKKSISIGTMGIVGGACNREDKPQDSTSKEITGSGGNACTMHKYKTASTLTTPDPAILHKEMCTLVKCHNIRNVCIEASSHGIAMHRLDGLTVKCAGFTNISHDHLDYHETMEKYFSAKARLFSEILCPEGTAVLHAGIAEYATLKSVCDKRNIKTLSYGIKDKCKNFTPDICLTRYTPTRSGFAVTINFKGESIDTSVQLPGIFQLENILCSIGMASTDGFDVREIVKKLPYVQGVCGRLQHVGQTVKGANIYVDFAHTPSALREVLQTIRPYTKNRVWVVVGCGGDRDRKKRPLMGEIATKFADKIIITDDNPRTEDASHIRRDIMKGAVNAVEIGDRKQAIQTTIQALEQGDSLIIAGKGHEQGQIVGTTVLPFDDAKVAKSILEAQ